MTDQLGLVARAERASRAADWPRAASRWRDVVDVNPVNGVFWDRLAEARFASGDYAGALTAYERAESLGVWPVRGPDPVPLKSIFPGEVAYQMACCHAMVGDTERALTALATAARQHLRGLDRALADPHLAALRDDPRLRDLVGVPDTEGLSRVDGWRHDLRVLRREVRHRIPFPHRADDDFDAAADALHGAIPDLDDARVVVGMWRLLRRLGDGHAGIDSASAFPDWERSLPVWFYLFAEGVFIPRADARYAHLLGAEVLAVDGRPVSQVIDALDPLLTRDNEYGPAASAPTWLRKPAFLHAVDAADQPDKATLTLRLPDGTRAEVTLDAEPGRPARAWPRRCAPDPVDLTNDPPLYLRDVDNPWWHEYLPAERLVYFQFNAIVDKPDEPLTAFYQRVFADVEAHDAAALVIDLRWNGGGNTFLAVPLVQHIIRRERINRRGALFVIIGRGTFSAAQNTATFLDRHTEAVFIGEPSGSSPNFVGETVPFRLPYSGVEVNVSDLYWQSSWPLDRRTAIAPDIYAPPTFTAYRANTDPAMDAIRQALRVTR